MTSRGSKIWEEERRREREEEEANGSYPTCLAYLTLLQSPLFRERLRDPIFAKDIERIGSRLHETWYVPFNPSASPSSSFCPLTLF